MPIGRKKASRWVRDPVVVASGGLLLAQCVGWVVWTGFIAQQPWQILYWIIGFVATMAACAIGVLRGFRWSGIWAAWVLGFVTSSTFPNVEITLANVLVIVLLVWSNVRLRRADRGVQRVRGTARDPVVLVAGASCLLATGALMGWIGVWVSESDIFTRHSGGGWFSPQALIAVRVVPVVALATAAVEAVRGSEGWCLTGIWLIVMIFATIMTLMDGAAAVVVMVVAIVLLALMGSACARLRKLAAEQEVVSG